MSVSHTFIVPSLTLKPASQGHVIFYSTQIKTSINLQLVFFFLCADKSEACGIFIVPLRHGDQRLLHGGGREHGPGGRRPRAHVHQHGVGGVRGRRRAGRLQHAVRPLRGRVLQQPWQAEVAAGRPPGVNQLCGDRLCLFQVREDDQRHVPGGGGEERADAFHRPRPALRGEAVGEAADARHLRNQVPLADRKVSFQESSC